MQKAFRLVLGLALCMASLLAISTSAISVAAHDHGTPVPTETSLVVPLGQLNDSGITGTATLDEADGKTTVTVDVTNAPSGVAMPSHIHVGTCDTLDPLPTFPLNDVVDGHAVTVVDTTIAHLVASPFAINLHKSAEEITTYVACGDVVSAAATPVAAESTLVVHLDQLNNSGITGTAKLDEANGKTTVTVDVTNAPSGVAMPSHIHVGTCDTLDPLPTFPLNDVVDGHAVTVIDTTIAHLLASPFAVNLHKSAEEITTYVACGNVTSTSATPAAAAATNGAPTLEIQIGDFSFTPASIEVKAGTSVTFTNVGVDHTATSNNAPKAFDSGILHKGQSFTVVLDTPGTYNYLCLLHPTMLGTIVVN